MRVGLAVFLWHLVSETITHLMTIAIRQLVTRFVLLLSFMSGEHALHKGHEGFERVEASRLVGYNMLHPSCTEPLCYVCLSVELHDKSAVAGQRRLIL